VDWHQADLSKLFEQIRERFPASEAEKMVWAFERAFEVAGSTSSCSSTFWSPRPASSRKRRM